MVLNAIEPVDPTDMRPLMDHLCCKVGLLVQCDIMRDLVLVDQILCKPYKHASSRDPEDRTKKLILGMYVALVKMNGHSFQRRRGLV